MRTENDRFPPIASGVPAPEETVHLLAEELRAVRRDVDRQRRHRQLMSLALAATCGLAGWSVHYLFPTAEARAPLQPEIRQLTAEERAAQREKLQAELPAIVAELNQINAKMAAIAGAMDSTMGRAGRMIPWMPFSP